MFAFFTCVFKSESILKEFLLEAGAKSEVSVSAAQLKPTTT